MLEAFLLENNHRISNETASALLKKSDCLHSASMTPRGARQCLLGRPSRFGRSVELGGWLFGNALFRTSTTSSSFSGAQTAANDSDLERISPRLSSRPRWRTGGGTTRLSRCSIPSLTKRRTLQSRSALWEIFAGPERPNVTAKPKGPGFRLRPRRERFLSVRSNRAIV